jgi:hypothetical protein
VNAYNLVNAWSAEIVPPTVTLTPASLIFTGTIDGTASTAQTVTLKNTSAATLSIKSGGITIGGANPAAFSETSTCGTTLAAGASCTIAVTFRPTTIGALHATLSVASNATGSPQSVSLTGTGAASTLIAIAPASLTFPNTVSGAESEAQAITVSNTGTGAVGLTSITVSGANPSSFEELNVCGASLGPGASCTILVAFRPNSAAAQKATLSITDNATGSPQTVALSGTGTAAPTLTVSATSLTFASTAAGSASSDQSVILTNSGSSAIEITNIALTGANATSFVQLNSCPISLAPGTSCIVSIAFVPASSGSLNATLSITDTGNGSPQSVKLAGTGVN